MSKNPWIRLSILSAGIIVLVAFGLWWQAATESTAKSKHVDFETFTVSSTEDQKESFDTPLETTERYVSDDFGVSFQFSPLEVTFNNLTHAPIETGDRIYVGGPSGQWVQVFPKKPTQSFHDAIYERFLSRVNPRDCYVERASYEWLQGIPDVSGAVIAYPISKDESLPWWESAAVCGNYATTNGISYFYYNARFPDRFYYFSIGQFGISAGIKDETSGKAVAWQETFTILK